MKLFSIVVVTTACALLTACVSESGPEPTPTSEKTPSPETKDTPSPDAPKSGQHDEGVAPPVQTDVSVLSASSGGPQPRLN